MEATVYRAILLNELSEIYSNNLSSASFINILKNPPHISYPPVPSESGG